MECENGVINVFADTLHGAVSHDEIGHPGMEGIEPSCLQVRTVDDARISIAVHVADVIVSIAVPTIDPLIVVRVRPASSAEVSLLIEQIKEIGRGRGGVCRRG